MLHVCRNSSKKPNEIGSANHQRSSESHIWWKIYQLCPDSKSVLENAHSHQNPSFTNKYDIPSQSKRQLMNSSTELRSFTPILSLEILYESNFVYYLHLADQENCNSRKLATRNSCVLKMAKNHWESFYMLSFLLMKISHPIFLPLSVCVFSLYRHEVFSEFYVFDTLSI